MAKKKKNRSGKGSQFERDICRELSRWWTGGKRDDVFWRTSTSGARATVRKRKGKSTAGSYGDIMAMDPIGVPLLDFTTIELKRGYSKGSPLDLVDGSKESCAIWYGWVRQATEAWESSGSLSWWLITKRDAREILVSMPQYQFELLDIPEPPLSLSFSFPFLVDVVKTFRLQYLLEHMKPAGICKLTSPLKR